MPRAVRRAGARCVILPLLMLTACQQQAANATDPISRLRLACAVGDPNACKALADASHTAAARPTADSRAAQVQKDVAAMQRGLRRNSD